MTGITFYVYFTEAGPPREELPERIPSSSIFANINTQSSF